MTLDAHAIAQDFPILSRKIRDGKRLVYLDSGATSQKPNVVIEAESDFYRLHNAAVHRGAHQLAEEATDAYEGARGTVAKFLGGNVDEIIFTKVDDTTFIFEGRTALNDLYKIIGIDGKDFEQVKGDADTIGGFILEKAGRIPKNNESYMQGDIQLVVESSDKKRVKMVKVKLKNKN